MHPPVISADRLTFSYGSNQVLKGVSITVNRGMIFALLGPNGAGKTTTAEILEGYLRPGSGAVRVLGEDPRRSRKLRSRIGVMLQKPGIYPALRAKEAIELFGSYHQDSMPVGDVLSLIGLEGVADSKVRTLSGGELQRLSLGLALVGKPNLLFLDEPTSSMDPIARAAIWDHLRKLADRGITIFLTTHALQEAEYLSDQVAIIAKGRILIEGTPDSLRSASEAFEFRTEPRVDPKRLTEGIDVEVVELEPGRYRVGEAASPAVMARLTRWTAEQGSMLSELKTKSTLEEIYVQALKTEEASE